MARRASLVGVVAILSGLAVTGAALARQNAQQAQPAPVAPPAPAAPTPPKPAPSTALRPSANPTATPDLRAAQPAQPAQVTPAQVNPTPTAAPKTPTADAASDAAMAAKPTTPKTPDLPAKRGRYAVAIMQALDKVTTETMRFEVPVGQPIRYKTLIFTVRACETAATDEIAPETSAYVVIDTQPKAQAGRAAPAGRQIYKGWMYASSPGLHPLEHPVYDAWLIACKQSVPDAPPAKP